MISVLRENKQVNKQYTNILRWHLTVLVRRSNLHLVYVTHTHTHTT